MVLEETENLNSHKITRGWNRNLKISDKEKSESDGFDGDFYWTFKEWEPILHKVFQKLKITFF